MLCRRRCSPMPRALQEPRGCALSSRLRSPSPSRRRPRRRGRARRRPRTVCRSCGWRRAARRAAASSSRSSSWPRIGSWGELLVRALALSCRCRADRDAAVALRLARHRSEGGAEVRVAARGTASGSVEFAIQAREADGSWGELLFGRVALHDAGADRAAAMALCLTRRSSTRQRSAPNRVAPNRVASDHGASFGIAFHGPALQELPGGSGEPVDQLHTG